METYTVKPGNDQVYHMQNQWSDLDGQRNVCSTWMKIKKQPVTKFGLVSAAALSVMGVLGMSFPALAGSSFQRSCFRPDMAIDLLTAYCDDRNGQAQAASIRVRGIENQNGNLVDTRNRRKKSTFQNSCTNIRLYNERYITASCTTRSGMQKFTYVELNGIANINGRLLYEN
jgi:CVNH domain